MEDDWVTLIIINGLTALEKNLQRDSSSLLPYEDTARKWPPMNQEMASHKTKSANSLILDFSVSRIVRNKFLLSISYPVYGYLL